ncbi:hypothetical protein ACUNHT_10950 [Serratia sp. IR-2025]
MRRKSIIACSVAAIVALAGALWPEKVRTSQAAQLKMAKYEDCRKTPYFRGAFLQAVSDSSRHRSNGTRFAGQRSLDGFTSLLSIGAALLAQLLHSSLNLADVGTQGAHFCQHISGLLDGALGNITSLFGQFPLMLLPSHPGQRRQK